MPSNGNGGVVGAGEDVRDPSTVSEPASATPRTTRLPYKAPQLRRLGSVRNLTLGSPMGAQMDGLPGGMKP